MPRPRLTPSAEQRQKVKSMAAMGIPQKRIAEMIGLRSEKTLRRHFRQELDAGETEANYNVGKTLYSMATSGKDPLATIFWMKARAGWRDRPSFEPASIPPPPFIVAHDKGVQP